jgi:hypothetical protein
VGYVHAIAHQFGGKYHTPHGLANAIMLPHVLEFSMPAITGRMAELAVRAKVAAEDDDEDAAAQKFLDAVIRMNAELGIPTHLAALKEADIPALARAACHEAHTGYPVPRYMSQAQCEAIIRKVLPPDAARAAPAASATARNPAGAKAGTKPAEKSRARTVATSVAPAPARRAAKKASS